ncbi:hypothetical protein FBUS_08796 [Fasciolopsis buskii]|uniref:Glutamate receptor n=1 Tax=Fasciolopsis buskii TaxID=27845 RepID=A0A8E0VKA7_9TREM|nr:hypothetical protein FBUS_08796 [Fasciolopsis buski]
MQISSDAWPPPRERGAQYSSFCEMDEPKLTVNTRYYQFVNSVTSLPTRIGTMGAIAFNGSYFNKNSKFRLHSCALSTIASASYCEDTGSTYSYTYNALETETKLDPVASPNRLRVAVVHDPPFVFKTTNGWTGYSVEVFEYLAKTLDLQYEYIEQSSRMYGEMLPDGSWNGIIGQVSSKKIDIGLGPIIKSQERLTVVDFSIPYYESAGLVIVSKREKLNNLPADFFLDFLTPECWLCVFGILFGFIIIFWMMDVVSPYSWRYHPESKRPQGVAILNCKESAWYVLGASLQQGDSCDPGSISCKLAIGSLWLFVACMTFMVSCNLSARLTVSGLNRGIQTLDQLIRQTKIPVKHPLPFSKTSLLRNYTIREQSVEYTFFKRMYEIENTLFETWVNITESSNQKSGTFFVSRYPITERYGTCFLRMQRWGFAKDVNHLLNLIQQNWIAFMESSLASYYVHSSCNMKIVGDRIGSWNYGIVLPKNSALTSMIDKALLQLKGDSILEALADRWWVKNNTNCMDLENTGLLLYELRGAFILFTTAIGTSMILFGIEILVWRCRKQPTDTVSHIWWADLFEEAN